MKTWTQHAALVACLGLVGCGTDVAAPDVAAPEAAAPQLAQSTAALKRKPRHLSATPDWRVSAPEGLQHLCFGISVATGDLTGDGRPELVVAAPPCSAAIPSPGAVAIYAGEGDGFATTPVVKHMNWLHPSPTTNANGRGMTVQTADVDGDGLQDLLVRSRAGVHVYRGQADLTTLMATPYFRHAATTIFTNALLADLDGDGKSDLASLRSGVVSIFRSTPGTAVPMTLVRTIPGATALSSYGSLDGDALPDLLLGTPSPDILTTGTALWPSCMGASMACIGGIATTPAWTLPNTVFGAAPDLDGDGRREVFTGDLGGRVRLHLSSGPGGAPAAEAAWTVLGDPLAPVFGRPVFWPGDLDGDGVENEFVVPAVARAYLFRTPGCTSAELRPVWALPEAEHHRDGFLGNVRFAFAAPGDLDADGAADVVVGLAPPFEFSRFGFEQPGDDTQDRDGEVHLYRGGRVKHGVGHRPYLPEPTACGLGEGDPAALPDLTVDRDLLARSVRIDRRYFAPEACEVSERCVDAPGVRKLLRFSTSIVNLGRGHAILPPEEEAPDLYYFDACHGHHHLGNFAQYVLADAATGTTAAVGRKQGFALIDYQPYCADAPAPVFPEAGYRISAGWADIYASDLPCQWLDVTDLADGEYRLQVGADTGDIIPEDDARPNSVEVRVRITGDTVELLDAPE